MKKNVVRDEQRSIRHLIEENNRLREQLHPDNEHYYSDMMVYIRTSGVEERQGEELLLELLQHLIEAQHGGKNAREVFGEDPEGYCKELIEQLPRAGKQEQLKLLVMVPWIALTWYFLVQGLFTLIRSFGGDGEGSRLVDIPLMVPVAIGLSSLLFVRLLLAVVHKSTFKQGKQSMKWQFIALNTVFIGAIVCVAVFGKEWLPTWSVSPWICLTIFAVGLLGQRVLFRD